MSDQPSPHAPESGDGEPEAADIVVSDPEDFARTRQLRSIFNARDHFIEERRRAEQAAQDGELSAPQKRKRVYQAMQDLVIALEPLIRGHEDGDWYLTEKEYEIPGACWGSDIPDKEQLAQIIPDEYQKQQRIAKRGPMGSTMNNISLGDRQVSSLQQSAASALGLFDDQLVISGMETIAQDVISVVYPFSEKIGRSSTSMIRRSAPKTHFSVQVFRDCQTILDDVGLGVEMGEEQQQTKITGDLIKEVQQWQDKNLD